MSAPFITKPLTRLFNLSLQTATLPKDWLCSNITPIFKKGSRHLTSNYRPMSLTCFMVKILEKLIHRRISEFLDEHSILSPLQHGFRKGYSCQTLLLESVHQWAKSLNHRSSTHVIFLDFAKAFDTVSHQKLIDKLDCICVRGQPLKWIAAFLSNRKQRVLVDG